MSNENRDEKGKFKKGCSGNPNGRPKKPRSEKLEAAIKDVEAEKGIELFKHFIERAYVNDSVLAVVMRKILPDLRAIEANIVASEVAKNQKDQKDMIDEAIALGQALDNAPDAMAV